MDEKNKIKQMDSNIGCIRVFSILFFIFLSGYLFLIQVVDFKKYRIKAYRQHTKEMEVLRGDIVDRNGLKLVSNKITYNIYAHKKDFNEEKRSVKQLATILSPVLNVKQEKIISLINNSDSNNVLLKKDVDRITANKLAKMRLREVSRDLINKRVYLQDNLASHVLGYYNPNADISSGVEYTAREYLESGENLTYQKTGKGDVIYNIGTDPKDLVAELKGPTLQLTIDSAVQYVSEQALNKKIKETNARRGAAIVMDTQTGDILAMAIAPSYNPNKYNKYPISYLKNWALTDVYPPGSTFKVLTVASGLALKKISKNEKILDTGKKKIGWWTIKNHDYNRNPFPGMIDLVYLFEHSSNIASAVIALKLDRNEFHGILSAFGIGSKTGIDLPGESLGIFPPAKKWDEARRGAMGYGYGASVTVIQMISAVNAIANKGVWVTPHIIKYSPEEMESKIVKRRVIEEDVAKDVADLLVKSVDRGKYKLSNYSVAAKTGTSRHGGTSSSDNEHSGRLYASVVGFLPAKNPKITIYVIVDGARRGAVWGSTVAEPVFYDIALDAIKILNISPDR